MVSKMIKQIRWSRGFGATVAMAAAAWIVAGCNSSSKDRTIVSTSDPRVACSAQEGPRGAKDAEDAIAHAKAAWAAIHEKDRNGETTAPAYIARFEPYSATLKDGVWHVQGTVPAGFHGQVPVMSVCRNDEGASAGSIDVP